MEELLNALAVKTQLNMMDEATAVKGYTEQANMIREIRDNHPELSNLCDEWDKINDELIADELNHQIKLNALYTSITGVEANKE